MHHLRAPIAATLFAVLATTAAACDEPDTLTLRFDRTNSDPIVHVMPTDRYLGTTSGRLDGFSEPQYEALPFLRQLGATHQTGWASTNAIRVPFSSPGGDAGRWLDAETFPDAFALYRTDVDPPVAVPIGERELLVATNTVLLRPNAPLAPGRYGLLVRDGVLATRDGGDVQRSADAQAVVSGGDPLTTASFQAVAQVDAHVTTRADALAFFELTVADQTPSLALLHAYVTGKAAVDRGGEDAVLGVTAWSPLAAREIAAEGGRVVADGDAAVAALFAAAGLGGLDTSTIGRVVEGRVATPNFISDPIPQLLEADANQTYKWRVQAEPFGPGNPLSLSASAPSRAIPYLLILPKVPAATPTPVAVAMHGISRAKEDWLAFAPALAEAGVALIAIDLYQHGARQHDIPTPEGGFGTKRDVGLAALDVDFPDPFINPTFLARTRDKLRQSAVDHLALTRLLTDAEGAGPVVDLDGDGTRDAWGDVLLVGHSLGAMLGTAVAAVEPAITRVVLSAPGGPLPEIVATSPTLALDVDLLLYGTANAEVVGLLAGTERRLLPDSDEREIFGRLAEVILAPIDPLTFAPHLLAGTLGNAQPPVLTQLPSADLVVPQATSARLARGIAGGATVAGAYRFVAPERFPTGLDTASALGDIGGVTQVEGGHGVLLDFADPALTAAAQAQAVTFLVGHAGAE